jgi:apolipoprotein N-acyltransferase
VTEDPWLLLGYALLPYDRLIQVAEITGVYGLSFLVVFVNAAVTEVAIHLWRRDHRTFSDRSTHPLAPLIAASIMLASVWAYGLIRLTAPSHSGAAAAVGIVQGNHALEAQWKPELHGETLDDYVRLSLTSLRDRRVALVVWPESAVTFFLGHDASYRAAVERFVRAAGEELILGTPHYVTRENATYFFSSAFHANSEGRFRERFDKNQLLPFIEYFPLGADSFLQRRFGRMRAMTPGIDEEPFYTTLGTTAVAICFEAVFPHVVRRRMAEADVLLNLSNDVWLGDGAGPRQHFAMVRLRAVENRTWVIRSTTTGISAVIDPHGRIVAHIPRGREGVMITDIVPQRVDTPYERWGDLFAFGCLTFAAWVAAFRSRPRPTKPGP